MEKHTRQVFAANFDAALRMLSNSVRICPDGLWQEHGRFYHLAYHTVIFADYYLSFPASDFDPMIPYTLADMDDLSETAVDDVLPTKPVMRAELLDYIESIRVKCHAIWKSDLDFEQTWILSAEVGMHGLCPSLVEKYSVTEILFYNFRHIQHHTAQLNLLLRQHGIIPPDWLA